MLRRKGRPSKLPTLPPKPNTCGSCGNGNKASAKFCSTCGAAMSAPTPAAAPAPGPPTGAASEKERTPTVDTSSSQDNADKPSPAVTPNIPPPPPDADRRGMIKVLREGILKKRARANRHLWQPRHFTLSRVGGGHTANHKFTLVYKKQKQQENQQGTLILVDQIERVQYRTQGKGAGTGQRFTLQLADGSEFELLASTPEECFGWTDALTKCIQESKQWAKTKAASGSGGDGTNDNDSNNDNDGDGADQEPLPCARERVEQSNSNPLLLAMVGGDYPQLLEAIKTADVAHLTQVSYALCAAVAMTPFWFRVQREALVQALERRIALDADLAQHFHCLCTSGSLEGRSGLFSFQEVPRSALPCVQFDALLDDRFQKQGAVWDMVSQAAADAAAAFMREQQQDQQDPSSDTKQPKAKQDKKKKQKQGQQSNRPSSPKGGGKRKKGGKQEKRQEKRQMQQGTGAKASETTVTLRHPFRVGQGVVTHMEVLRVFKSNAKPLLLKMSTAAAHLPPVIFKAGDDLRQDSACLQAFRLMNKLWADEKLEHNGQLLMAMPYSCLPVGASSGFIEFLSGCESLKNITRVAAHHISSPEARARMIASAAGSYIASYVLGVRDRHYDNILVRKDGTVFHIDFGHVLGHTVTMDAAPVAITPALQEVMGDDWRSFLNLSVRAFAVLRNNVELLTEYVGLVFSTFLPREQVRAFLHKTLLLDQSLAAACKSIQAMFRNAPASTKTRFKNLVHGFATSS